MNDPIADICLKWMMKFARHDDGNPALAAKEIRQQIGRELLDVRFEQQFVERACAIVDSVETNSKAIGFNNGWTQCKAKIKRALRDEFKC